MKFGTGHPRGLVLARWAPDLNHTDVSFSFSLPRTVILRTPSRVTVHQSCFDANVHDRQPPRRGANRAGSLCNTAMQLYIKLMEKGLARPLCALIIS